MDYNKAIESVCFKFGHAVTEYDVFRWLRNFDESEWTMALNVLDKVVYYSSDMIDENLEYHIKKIIEENSGQHIYILPSGNVGKSGHAMAYHAKKVIEKQNLPENVLSLLNLKNLKDIKKDSVIALCLPSNSISPSTHSWKPRSYLHQEKNTQPLSSPSFFCH